MISLRTFSTIKIGGSAEKIVPLKRLSDLEQELPTPIRILGNGSNILIDDRGLKGAVLILRDFPPTEPEILLESKNEIRLKVSAGIFLPTLSRWTSKRGFSGCEYMVGVPGTVGGALIQNAGANDQEFKDIFISAEAYNLNTHKRELLSHEDIQLSYRQSSLKSQPEKLVLSVELKLSRNAPEKIQNQIEKNLDYRKRFTPYAKPSLGSTYTRLKEGENWVFPGKLIEEAGLKGLRRGGAQISSIHANYIINEGHATFEDVIGLMKEVEKRVFEHSGKRLIREILVWTDRNESHEKV